MLRLETDTSDADITVMDVERVPLVDDHECCCAHCIPDGCLLG